MQMFSCLKVFVFLGIVLFLALNPADVNAQMPFLSLMGSLGEDSIYAVGDIVEVVFFAVTLDDESTALVSGAKLIITHSGLTNVIISNGGATDVSGEVMVRGTIADDTDVYIQAYWPDKGLTNRGELRVIKNVAKQTAQDINAQVPVLIGPLSEDSIYAVGDIVEVVFVAGTLDDDPTAPMSARLTITHSGLTNVTISNGGTTDVSGEVIVRGTIADDTDVYIQAHWPDEGLANTGELRVIKNVAKQTVQAVFDRHSNTFQHPDVHEHFPEVLRTFKNPEIQSVLNPVVINHFVRDPEYIRAFYPDVDESIITLLTTDNGFRALFEDEDFQGVLQVPAEIDALVGLIETQPQREPRMVTIVSGNLQKGEPQTALGNPLVVLVQDQYGAPLSGVDVAFRVTRGGGRLSRTRAQTNGTGRAETTLTLGAVPGIHQVEASVVGFPSLTQTFTAAATAVREVPSLVAPTTLSIVSGNHQSGEVGKRLAQPFVMGVLDQDGKPLQGIQVTFAVTAGNGQLSVTRQSTNVYGQARTTLTLGSRAGHHSVRASVSGITHTRTFTATAIAPPPPPEEPEPVVPVPPSTDEPDQQLPPVVYWIEEGAIFRLDGGNKQALVKPSEGWTVTSLAMDMAKNILYWTERQADKQMGRIWSGNLNDRNARELQSIAAVPEGIVVDAANDKLYWANDRGKIQRINVDGKNFKGNLITGLGLPHHITLDSATEDIYWTVYDATAGSWSIWSAPFDGNITKEEIVTGLGQLEGIAVADDRVYWTEVKGNSGKIRSANKRNGSGVKILFSLSGSIPLGLAVDEVGRRLYWTDNGGNIRSLNLDNPIETEIVVEGLDAPAVAIALGRSSGASVPASPAAPSTTVERPVESDLLANYPNPFNPETWIPYQLSKPADVSVSIYAIDGHLVRRLDLGHQSAGMYRSRGRAAHWNGRNAFGERVASGLYFYTLTAGDFTATRKMLIRK